ncbi:MAG: hypothetical protein Q3983_09695, partial [Capnocytophaga sp.]|nr:hypothetical protein [Capnocytophaga sp.]
YNFIGNLFRNYTLDEKYYINFVENKITLTDLEKNNEFSYNISNLLKENVVKLNKNNNEILHPNEPILIEFSILNYDFAILPTIVLFKEKNNEIIDCRIDDDVECIFFIKKN